MEGEECKLEVSPSKERHFLEQSEPLHLPLEQPTSGSKRRGNTRVHETGVTDKACPVWKSGSSKPAPALVYGTGI